MRAQHVLELYRACADAGVRVWIDGGWCVDALLGRETRPHGDLDLAVHRDDAERLSEVLAGLGFRPAPRPDETAWNYVLARASDGAAEVRAEDVQVVDVHVFAHDAEGRVVYGIGYPAASLSGTGTIRGQEVDCIAADWMFAFKTAYPPAPKDRQDLQALAAAFGFAVPESHR